MSRPSPRSSAKVSAFQVFSTVSKVSPHGGKNKLLSDLENPKKKPTPKALMSKDLSRKPSSAPKSLIAMVNEADSKREESTITRKINLKRTKEGKLKSDNADSVKSLLDLSFDNSSVRMEGQFRRSHAQETKTGQSGVFFRLDAPVNLQSHSESNKINKKPFPIRVSETSPSSKLKPLVVDMQTVERTAHSSPKPLLDFSSMGSPTKKPMTSLLDLPQPRERTWLKNFAQKPRASKVGPGQLLSIFKKKKMDEIVRPTENETSFDSEKVPPVKKKRHLEPSLKSKKILTCPGKRCCFLIIPASCSWLHLYGKGKLCVDKGTVSIMAYTLRPKVTYDVYSPATGCLLAMHIDDTNKISASDVKKEMSKFCASEVVDNLKYLDDNTIAVIRVKQLQSRVCDYLTSFIPFTQLFKVTPPKDHEKSDLVGVSLVNVGLKVAPHSEMGHTCMNWSPEFNNELDKWSKKVSSQDAIGQGPILLTCGGKNSGKSILNRCAINVTLQSVDEVAYLDCDVGQTEFSPPATLSLHIIKSPILGPPFSHQKQAERMVFYGDVNPAQDPGFYLRCLQFVFQAYTSLASKSYLPLIVNTMGFPEGVGLMLFVDTINLVKPDIVIQLESVVQYNNFPAVTQEMVALEEGWTSNKSPPEDKDEKVGQTKAHELILLRSLASPKRDFSLKLQPMDIRNLALLSALSSGLERDMTLMSLTPYAVPYKHIAVHVCHHRLSSRELLHALNASVVALCEADLSQMTKDEEQLPFLFKDMPICNCIGIGLIRAVDQTKGVLLVSTTLPRAQLRKVNAILKGNLPLPDHFFLNQKSEQPIPFVDALTPSTAVSAVRPRARMPRVTLGKSQ